LELAKFLGLASSIDDLITSDHSFAFPHLAVIKQTVDAIAVAIALLRR
jgi:hypothetical protein